MIKHKVSNHFVIIIIDVDDVDDENERKKK